MVTTSKGVAGPADASYDGPNIETDVVVKMATGKSALKGQVVCLLWQPATGTYGSTVFTATGAGRQFGVALADIAVSAYGFVRVEGPVDALVEGKTSDDDTAVDTSIVQGDTLYVDDDGGADPLPLRQALAGDQAIAYMPLGATAVLTDAAAAFRLVYMQGLNHHAI